MNVVVLSFLVLMSPTTDPFVPATRVVVNNQCVGTTVKFLAGSRSKTLALSSTEYQLKAMPNSLYPLVICTDTQCYRYGNMTFLSTRHYNVKISRCKFPAARIESHEVITKKSAEAPSLRFRSAHRKSVEYRAGLSPYRRLGVGMTSYKTIKWPMAPTGIRIQFRYRMVPAGPVEYVSTHNLTEFNPAHRYFIEVGYFGEQKEYLKIQDEGEAPPMVKNEKD